MKASIVRLTISPGVAVSHHNRNSFVTGLVTAYDFIPQARFAWTPVPSGWLALIGQFSHRAEALRERAGSFVVYEFAIEEDSRLVMKTEGASKALTGLLRKFSDKSRFTCRRCGAAGKPYPIDDSKYRSYCSVCAAPLLLAGDLARLARVHPPTNGNVPIVEFNRIPASFRSIFSSWLEDRPLIRTSEGCPRGAYSWDYFEWAGNLKNLYSLTEKLAAERIKE